MSSKYKSLKKQFITDLNNVGILSGWENKINEKHFIKRFTRYLILRAGSLNKTKKNNFVLKMELLKHKMLTEMNLRNNSGRKVKIIANPIPTYKVPLILEALHMFGEYSIDANIFEKINHLNKQILDFLINPNYYSEQLK